MVICEDNSRYTQPDDRAPSASPHNFSRVRTPPIEGGLSYFDQIFCTLRQGKVGGSGSAISRVAAG